jgi:threonine dehydrogenase-like Zn-dependent dehydrogenase
MAQRFGAIAINAASCDPVQQIRNLTTNRGADVALELIGLPATMRQAVQSLGILGRAGLVGLTKKTFELAPYQEVLNKEAEIIGVSDHLASEVPNLLEYARTGQLDLSHNIIRAIAFDAGAVNDFLDDLERFGDDIRVAITP